MRLERDGFSVDAARRKGRALPDWYVDAPPDVDDADVWYEAFRDLQTERQPDGPIPHSATMAYADRKGFAPDVADALWTVIRCMDLAERRWRFEEAKAALDG